MDPDVIVIGAGPNGLTAAAILGMAGLKVLVLEGSPTIGGAVKTAEVTRPGFKHDVFSGFYPLLPVGPIGQLGLERYGLTLRSFETPFAGGTPTGPGVSVHRKPRDSAASFEQGAPGDGRGYTRLWNWWTHGSPAVQDLLFNPLGSPKALISARRLGSLAHLLDFARLSVGPAAGVAAEYFQGADARVWFIGSPLHSDLGADDSGGGLYGLVMMGLAQQVGMPIAEGGAQAIPKALETLIRLHGGEIRTGERVTRIHVRGGRAEAVETSRETYRARSAVLATVAPPSLFLDLVERQSLPARFVELVRNFRWGTGVFKIDFALSGLPDFNGAKLNGAGVLHLGRSPESMRLAANQARSGVIPAEPPIIAGIHTLADPSRAPAGAHTFWLETHVPSLPHGESSWSPHKDRFTARVIQEMEAYAPNFSDLVIDAYAQSPDDLHAANPNLVGGDIAGGSFTIDQQLIFRPLPGWFRHSTPIRGLYIGGASTHPGGGVHGAAGANSARVLLQDLKLAAGPAELGRSIMRSGRRLFTHLLGGTCA